MFKVHNIFSIGYRCNACDFLSQYLNVRKYSSPFSYMLIDIETALNFIRTRFENFTSKDFLKSPENYIRYNNLNWKCNHVHIISDEIEKGVDVYDMKKTCIWNHHNLFDKEVVESIDRRSKHLLHVLDTKPESMLLFYIDKVREFPNFDISLLKDFKCNFLVLAPILNFKLEPTLVYDNGKIKVIYFKSDLANGAADAGNHPEEWKKLAILIKSLYEFEIEERCLPLRNGELIPHVK